MKTLRVADLDISRLGIGAQFYIFDGKNLYEAYVIEPSSRKVRLEGRLLEEPVQVHLKKQSSSNITIPEAHTSYILVANVRIHQLCRERIRRFLRDRLSKSLSIARDL